MENAIGDLRGIALRVRVALGGMALLPVLILPGQEHGLAFHRFVSSLVASSSALWFSESMSLGRFIPGHFIHFEALLSGMVSLVSLAALSLLT